LPKVVVDLQRANFDSFLATHRDRITNCKTQIEVARQLLYATEEQLKSIEILSMEVGKMLSALIGTLTVPKRG
jgi:hypothetical protein